MVKCIGTFCKVVFHSPQNHIIMVCKLSYFLATATENCTCDISITTHDTLFWQLQIWDTAGQERFRSITQSYYRSANALILTYDITCEDSFCCLPEWLREIEQYANNQVVTILVGEPPNCIYVPLIYS